MAIQKNKKPVPQKKAASAKANVKKVAKQAAKANPAPAVKEVAIVSSPFWNIWDTGSEYKVRVSIPGLTKKNIKVDVEGNRLTLSSEKEAKSETVKKNYVVREYNYDSWTKSIVLPKKVNEEDVKINYKDGVLKIGLTKL